MGFLLGAQVMTGVLYHFLTDSRFRDTVKEEHHAMAGLFDQYLTALTEVYGVEISTIQPGG